MSEKIEEESYGDVVEFCKIPRTRHEIAEFLGIKTVFYASSTYILPLVAQGKLKMTIPDKPKSKNQKYYSGL